MMGMRRINRSARGFVILVRVTVRRVCIASDTVIDGRQHSDTV